MNLSNLVGQTIDEKYKIERELGKGGMGAVYLATHIGTERPVAVKVIVPQFMRKAEFVERFKREARAAGRLRHPNVVDVTDFGFDDTPQGRIAYLVMEYLDGCTLGEILEEEHQLPLEWSLDILEQVSSAVQTAHEQGIIHRDLKPDNIWLEPNQRGGYTVKVLDFGIAKLEENMRDAAGAGALPNASSHPTRVNPQNTTAADAAQTGTIAAENGNSTAVSEAATAAQTEIPGGAFAEEAGTLIQPPEAGTLLQPLAEIDLESGTAILPHAAPKNTSGGQENLGTRLMSAQVGATNENAVAKKSTAELTRVGAVLGTPLYMSPEQCRGERLDARSDIYSLAVIAYQMLSGKTPFEGDFKAVMNAHIEQEPPPLNIKKVPKKVKSAVMAALSKNAEDRPQTAQTFANQLRSHSEGVGKLLQRSLVIYSQHLPTFLWISFLLSLPVIFLTVGHFVIEYLALAEVIPMWFKHLSNAVYVLGAFFVGIWFGSALIGVTTWMVAQILAVPLRPVSWRPALAQVRTKWRAIARTVTWTTLISFVGFAFCIIPGLILSMRYALVSPVIMMENLKGKAAIRRSVQLTRRAYWTAFATMLIYLMLPIILSGVSAKLADSMVNFGEDEPQAATPVNDSGVVKFNQDRRANFGIQVSPSSAGSSSNQTAGTEGQEQVDDDEAAAIREAQEKIKSLPVPPAVQQEFSEAIKQAQEAERVKAEKAKAETPAQRKTARRFAATVKETLIQLFWLPISIILGSFSSITFALLYLKTRQAGGESMNDLLGQFESAERPQSNWQKRVRARLIQSGRITGKT
ncbi:MAG TPA: protein kinase [Pyrinomonadaceae bacterium]|nr:protein kinase [Pyrinomonadaceae bacterium]